MPAGDNSFPFDVSLTVNGGSTYGFMLVSPPGQTKQLQTTEAPPIESQRLVTQDIANARDFDPKLDTPFSMSDFSGGVGQMEFDFSDEKAYWWGSGVITHVPGKVFLAPPVASTETLTGSTGDVAGMCTYLTSANVRYDFLWEGLNIWRRTAANATNDWTKVYTAGVAITDFKIFNGVGVIAIPSDATTTDFLTQADVTAAATWVPIGRNHSPFSSGTKPTRFESIRGTLYAFVNNDLVYYTTDPTVDGWTGPIDIALSGTGNLGGSTGDSTYSIQGVSVVNDFLFVRKKDAVYSIDSQQDVIEVLWQWKDKPSEYNFKYAAVGGDLLIYNVGPEVWIYDPQTGQNVNTGLSKKSGFTVKEVLGISADSQFMYVLAKVRVNTIRSEDSIALFMGTKIRPGQYAWEVAYEVTSIGTDTYGPMFVFPQGLGSRVYIVRNDSGDTDTIIIDFPAEWDSSLSSTFATTGTLWTSITRGGFPGFQKRQLYTNINALQVDATETITASLVTDISTTNYSAMTSSPQETNLTSKYGLYNYFKFVLAGDGSATPVLKNFDHHTRVRFKYLPQVQVSIRIADYTELRNGSKSTLKAHQLWDNLTTLRTTNSEITYKDFLGNSFPVTVDQIFVQPSRHEGKLQYEEEAVVIMTRCDRGA